MPNKDYYDVYGYDKDHDILHKIASTHDFTQAELVAKALMHYHNDVEEITNPNNGEPFDWFHIEDKPGKIMKVFTFEYPDGINPEELS